VDGGFSVEMPAPVRERRAREGKMIAYIAHAIGAGGTRYEVARFDLPPGVDDAARADLMARAERGLGGVRGARVIARRDVVVDGAPARELEVILPGGERGRWWLFFVGGERMFQVSALGPPSALRDADDARFFRSFRQRAR
jgi:hypothetical protein